MELGNLIFGHSYGKYPIDREAFETEISDLFNKLLESVECDGYGYYTGKDKTKRTKLGGYHCDLFEINPYYWGDCTCGANEDEPHKSNCALCIPNFIFFPVEKDGDEPLELRWYKYPFRDSYSNKELSTDKFKAILKTCLDNKNGI